MKLNIVFLLVILTGCNSNPRVEKSQPARAAAATFDETGLLPTQSATCVEQGGRIQNVCMSHYPFCVIEHNDAGNECADSNDCSGDCRVEGQFVKAGTAVTGVCSTNNLPCGCNQTIENGVAMPALCRD